LIFFQTEESKRVKAPRYNFTQMAYIRYISEESVQYGPLRGRHPDDVWGVAGKTQIFNDVCDFINASLGNTGDDYEDVETINPYAVNVVRRYKETGIISWDPEEKERKRLKHALGPRFRLGERRSGS